MIYRWINKNVNLELLAQEVEDFFKEKGFKTRYDKKNQEEYAVYTIVKQEKRQKAVTARIHGKPNDFYIEFPADNHSFSTFGSLTSMFGGGFLILKELKDKDFLRKLEDDLWVYLENIVEGTAGKAQQET